MSPTLQLSLAGCGDKFAQQEAGVTGLAELQKLRQDLCQHFSAVLCCSVLCTRLQDARSLVV